MAYVLDNAGRKKYLAVTSITSSSNTVSLTTGEAITQGDAVYLKSDGNVWKANSASTLAASRVIGIAAADAVLGASVDIVVGGPSDDLGALTVGSTYYVSSVDGAVTSTVPTSSGERVVEVGVALSATTIAVNPQFIVERA